MDLRAKTYGYLIDDASEDKKAKGIKKRVLKKIKLENLKNCLEATQLDNKMNYLHKNKINVNSIKKYHREFIKTINSLKTQQRFKSERHNAFTEEIIKIALRSNNDKRIKSIDSKGQMHMEWGKI